MRDLSTFYAALVEVPFAGSEWPAQNLPCKDLEIAPEIHNEKAPVEAVRQNPHADQLQLIMQPLSTSMRSPLTSNKRRKTGSEWPAQNFP